MIAGMAIAGPIGLVAGSFLGSSTAQSSVRAVGGDPNANEGDKDGKPYASGQGSTFPPGDGSGTNDARTVHKQVPDLLSSPDGYVYPNSQSPSSWSNINATTNSVNISAVPATTAEAELIGDVATANHQTVMVQARVVDPLSSHILDASGQFSQATGRNTFGTTTQNRGVASLQERFPPPSSQNPSSIPSQFRDPNRHHQLSLDQPMAPVASSSDHYYVTAQAQTNHLQSTTTTDPTSAFQGQANPRGWQPRQYDAGAAPVPQSRSLESPHHRHPPPSSGFQGTGSQRPVSNTSYAMPVSSPYAASASSGRPSPHARAPPNQGGSGGQAHPEGQGGYRFGKFKSNLSYSST
jgi:hypothetical protein